MKTLKAVAAASLFAVSLTAQSQILWDTLATNTLTFYEDQNRESIFDLDDDGAVSEGDVFIGYARVDDKSVPLPGTPTGDELYAVFSIQVADIQVVDDNAAGTSTHTITYETTTAAGLTMSDLTGDANAPGNVVAVYEDVNQNLISGSSGEVNGDGQFNIFDFIAEITNDTLDLFVAIDTVVADHWVSTADVLQAGDPIENLVLLESATLANGLPGAAIAFHAAGDVTYSTGPIGADCITDNPCFDRLVNDVVEGGYLAEATVQNGDISGASDLNFAGEGNPFFSGSANTAQGNGQWNGFNFYGLSSNADFGFHVTSVPEPSTIALLGLGLFGVGAARRRQRA